MPMVRLLSLTAYPPSAVKSDRLDGLVRHACLGGSYTLVAEGEDESQSTTNIHAMIGHYGKKITPELTRELLEQFPDNFASTKMEFGAFLDLHLEWFVFSHSLVLYRNTTDKELAFSG